MSNKSPPNAERTQFHSGAEAVENGRRGGIASGKSRRERAALRAALEDLLTRTVSDPATLERYRTMGFWGTTRKRVTFQEGVLIGMIIAAMNGNPQAFKLIKDIVEPPEEREVETEDLDELEEELFGYSSRSSE